MAESSPIKELPAKTQKEVKALSLKMEQITRTESIFSENQVQKIFNTTLARYRYSRPGKGGGNWSYVRASYMRRVLDSLFGFNWDFEVETGLAEAFEVAKLTKTCVVKGTLVGRVKKDGQYVAVRKTQFGRAEVKFKKDTDQPLDFGNDMKAAATDCFKKCATLFGIAADVYDPQEYQEIEVVGADRDSDKTKATEAKIKAAKKELKTKATEVEG